MSPLIESVANLDHGAKDTVDARLHHRYGIYYGYAWFRDQPDSTRHRMVMSFGRNPQYGNAESSAVPAVAPPVHLLWRCSQ